MHGTICLLILFTFVTRQATHNAAAEGSNVLNRVKHLSSRVQQGLHKIRVQDKFDTYLEVHLLMVKAITNASEPVLSEIKVVKADVERGKQHDICTDQTVKFCLTEAKTHINKLSRNVYINEIGNCTKTFVINYEETASAALQLSYECAQTNGRLFRAIQHCKSADDEDACIDYEARAVEEILEKLELSGESIKRELNFTVQKGLQDLLYCFDSTSTPVLQTKLLTIKQEFFDCIVK